MSGWERTHSSSKDYPYCRICCVNLATGPIDRSMGARRCRPLRAPQLSQHVKEPLVTAEGRG